MNERALEERLRRLPGQVPYPSTPDIASSIGSILPERSSNYVKQHSPWVFGAIAIAAILLLVILPAPRHAVADFLGLPGIRIELVDRHTTENAPMSIGSTLLFGEMASLEAAQETAPFAISVPNRDDLRQPSEVWLRNTDQVVAVSFIYAASDELPEVGDTGVGMLLMQFETNEESPFIAKRSMGNGSLERVQMAGREAWWVSGGELVLLPDALPAGPENGTYQRRSGNVLIWSDGQTTYRLETALDQASAIRIAESLVPYDASANGNH